MTRWLAVLGVGCLCVSIRADEATDKRLAELLQPSITVNVLAGHPRDAAEPRVVLPPLRMPKFQGQPPRPQPSALRVSLPQNPAESAPFLAFAASTPPPEQVVLPTKPLVALPVVDVNVRTRLPILAKPTVDRAPLTDATLEASVASTQRAAIPSRAQPVPFTPMNLPDPFELQNLIRLQNPPAEETQPMAGPVRILVKPSEPVKAPSK